MKLYEINQKVSFCFTCEKIKNISEFVGENTIHNICRSCGFKSDYENKKHLFLANLKNLKYIKGTIIVSDVDIIKDFYQFQQASIKLDMSMEKSMDLFNYLYATKENNKIDYLKKFKTDRSENKNRYSEREKARAKSDICHYCGLDDCHSVDHVIPISLGGVDNDSNMVISCSLCNKLKGSLDVDVFLLFYKKHSYLFDNRVSLIKEIRVLNKKLSDSVEKIKKINKECLEKGKYPSTHPEYKDIDYMIKQYITLIDNKNIELEKVIYLLKNNFNFYYEYVIL